MTDVRGDFGTQLPRSPRWKEYWECWTKTVERCGSLLDCHYLDLQLGEYYGISASLILSVRKTRHTFVGVCDLLAVPLILELGFYFS